MFKTVGKFVLVFVGAAVFAVVVATVSYMIARNAVSTKTAKESLIQNSKNSTSVMASPAPDNQDNKEVDFYTVRLEDENISVYGTTGGSEEFLYSTPIIRSDLPKEDIDILTAGVMMETSADLTAFMEDYTS